MTADHNSIMGLQLQNQNTGISAEMRFIVANDENNYMAFTQPGSGNTGSFFGLDKDSGSFIFNTGDEDRSMGIGTLSAGADLILGSGNVERGRITDTGLELGGGNARVTTIYDTDAMTEDSATALATQQSIKAYVDNNAGISDVVDDTTPQLGGNLDWNSNGTMIVGQTVGGSDGNIVYCSSANTWSQADASAESTCSKQLGIRISSTTVLTMGLYTTSGLTAGSVYYVSETGGAKTTTAPTTSGSIVRIIGYALSTTEFFLCPSGTFVENA